MYIMILHLFINYWYKHEQLTPSDILTALIAPLIFFIAGLGVGWVKEYRKKRKEKADEELLKNIIIDWLKKIKGRLEEQESKLQRVVDGYKRDEDKIPQEFVIIPIDRLLSLPDTELRKVINVEEYYISIVSDLSYVRVSQEYLREMFKDWAEKSLVIDRHRRDLNYRGFETTFRLCSVNTPEEFGEGLFLAWSGLTKDRAKEDIIGLNSVDFYNEFLMVFYKNVELNILNYNPEKLHPYVEQFLFFMEEYKTFIGDSTAGKIEYVKNLEYQKSQFKNMADNIGKFINTTKSGSHNP